MNNRNLPVKQLRKQCDKQHKYEIKNHQSIYLHSYEVFPALKYQ